ncbi:MAG: hypothetical protein MK212_08610 [Saprospiraceae bacterium]|nr:hypothetical protein [Saprospiraceae bacterium]
MNEKYHASDFLISSTELQIHPESKTILEQAKDKSLELGIYSETFYNGHHTMTPYIFTDTDIGRSITSTVWFSTLYFLDDFFGEDMRKDEEMPDFKLLFGIWMGMDHRIDDIPEQFSCLYKAISYCSHQIRVNSNYNFFKRYTEWLYHHMLYTLNPVDYKTVDEYIESRIHFGGMYPTMGMIEYTNDVYLDPSLLSRFEPLKQAVQDCALIGVLSNDLISYHKEKHSEQNLLNAYLKTGTVNTLDEAIQKGIMYVNDCYISFKKQSNLVRAKVAVFPAREKQIILTYLEGLERLISASYHWQMSTNRYRSTENIFADLRQRIVG